MKDIDTDTYLEALAEFPEKDKTMWAETDKAAKAISQRYGPALDELDAKMTKQRERIDWAEAARDEAENRQRK